MNLRMNLSRPSRARGLKLVHGLAANDRRVSRPSRARGLKQFQTATSADNAASRPSRARGLKHDFGSLTYQGLGRAPRGRVD